MVAPSLLCKKNECTKLSSSMRNKNIRLMTIIVEINGVKNVDFFSNIVNIIKFCNFLNTFFTLERRVLEYIYLDS